MPRPVPAAVGVVFREGRVLLVRRSHKPDAGKWGFPGGKIEWGESLEQATERELMEETGLTVKAERVISAVDFMDRRENGRVNAHYVLVVMLCRWVAGEAEAADDAMEARWFMPEECAHDKLPMSRDVPKILRLALDLAAPGTI